MSIEDGCRACLTEYGAQYTIPDNLHTCDRGRRVPRVGGIEEFLRARLDEEQDAAERTQPGPWIATPAPMPGEVEVRHRMPDGRPDVAAVVATTHGLRCAARDADHITHYNPARILAEVAMKRELLRLHGPMSVLPGSEWFNDAHLTREPMRLCRSCEPEKMFRREQSWPCRTVRALAVPYADHPDYDESWRP